MFGIAAPLKAKPRKTKIWQCPIVLDQGDIGACTGFSITHHAAAMPDPQRKVSNRTGLAMYKLAQKLDDIDGTDYEGSTVLGAMKAALKKGWITEYRWAFGENQLAQAIGYVGPVVLGINWYADMSKPRGDGLIYISGKLEGGHAILCNGYDHKLGLYQLHNSWGIGWGINGECLVTREAMIFLLNEHGEAAIPIKAK